MQKPSKITLLWVISYEIRYKIVSFLAEEEHLYAKLFENLLFA